MSEQGSAPREEKRGGYPAGDKKVQDLKPPPRGLQSPQQPPKQGQQ